MSQEPFQYYEETQSTFPDGPGFFQTLLGILGIAWPKSMENIDFDEQEPIDAEDKMIID